MPIGWKTERRKFRVNFHEHVCPSRKERKNTMSETKTTEWGWPMPPMWDASDWDWDEFEGKARGKAEDFRSDFRTFWEAGIDWQKDAIDLTKKQRKQLFENMQDAKDSFADFLPDKELPFAPEEFSSPKKFRKAAKEWEKMIYEQITSQADATADFAIKSQEKACAEVPEVPEKPKKKKKAEKKEPAKAEEKAAPAKKTTATAKKATAAAAK